jgi:hypothetical protein
MEVIQRKYSIHRGELRKRTLSMRAIMAGGSEEVPLLIERIIVGSIGVKKGAEGELPPGAGVYNDLDALLWHGLVSGLGVEAPSF